jgi:FemAB-related protein (PEP-CTERM system-associated)
MLAAVDQRIAVTRAAPDTAPAEWAYAAGTLAGAHLAHAPQWARVIRQAYGYDPLYFAAEDRAGHTGVLPAVVVRRPLFGTVVASMPFLDGGGPCASSPAIASALTDVIVEAARRLGASAVEFRSAHRLDIAAQPADHKVNLVLPLDSDPDRVWRQLDKSVRNQVRKAERSGLSIATGGLQHLDEFYDIHAARMRDLGSPAHARSFFRAIVDAFGRDAHITLVRNESKAIGGLMALAFKDSLVVPWASCLKEHFALCPNMLMYWETIRTACRDGFRRFDFGRSTRGSGTYHFKRQWGAAEHPLFWYSIPIGRPHPASPRAEHGRAGRFLIRLWQHLPLTVTRSIGPRVRRYLIQ